MDTERFDRFATALATETSTTRRGALRLVAGAFGLAGAAAAGAAVDARRKGNGKGKGKGRRPADRCPVSRPAPNSPVCGTDPGAGDCTCTRAVEGNNICVGFIESCAALTPCNSTRDCRESVGFHFFCQAEGTGSCGQRCVPECGNTNPF